MTGDVKNSSSFLSADNYKVKLMRGFGGPSRRKSHKSRSIHETIVMHRKLGTFSKGKSSDGNSLLRADWDRKNNNSKFSN